MSGVVEVCEFSGMGNAPTTDGNNTNTSTLTDVITTNSVTPTNVNDILVACAAFTAVGAAFSSGPTNSWTGITASAGQLFAANIPGVTTAQSTGWTMTGTGADWTAVIAAFTPGTSSSAQQLMMMGVGS